MNQSMLSDSSGIINEEDDRRDENDDENIVEVDTDHKNIQISPLSKGYFLEAALIFLFLGNNLVSTLLQNQILKLTCQSTGLYNDTICNALSKNNNDTKEIEEKIQPLAAEVIMTNQIINTITTAIISLFLGPHSDVYGRKKILNTTFCGFTLTLILFTIVTFYSEIQHLSPWAYTVSYLPQILSGGWPALLTSTLCYITDTNEESKRAFRLTIVEAIIFLGVLLGNLTCNFLLPRTDTTTVFVISSSFAILASLITIFFVEESVNNIPQNESLCDELKNLISPRHFIEMVQTCFKKRELKARRILLCLIFMLTMTVFTYNGGASVSYLFERERFGWSLPQHNIYESANIILSISGCIIGLSILKRFFKFSDMALIFVSLTSSVFDSSLKAFASLGWQMYAISAIALFRILASPMYRTLLTTIVPNNEIGKVFAATTSFEAISGMAASPLYTIVYSKTLLFFPGAFFLISAFVYSLNFLLAIFVMIMKNTRESLLTPYAVIEN